MSGYIFAIDPGNIESGWVLCEAESLKPVRFGKDPNEKVLIDVIEKVINYRKSDTGLMMKPKCCIEMIASYGMPVGKEVFDTCVWIGRFSERIAEGLPVSAGDRLRAKRNGFESAFMQRTPTLVYRLDEKLTICHDPKANDATIRRALVDRFAPGVSNYGKGNMSSPGWFYGFKADIWQAYAVAVTYHDKYMRGENAD